MKKTLLVTTDFPPIIGGVANYYKNICRNLPAKSLVVLAPKSKGYQDFDKNQQYKIYRERLLLRTKFFWPHWLPLIYYTWKIVKKEKIKIIQVGQILPVGIVALLFKKLFKIPYLVYVHGMDITVPLVFLRKRILIKIIIKNAYKIITNSYFNKNELKKLGAQEEQVIIVFPSVGAQYLTLDGREAGELKAKYKLEGKKILLTVGRLVKRKGHDMVIKSLPKVLKKIPDLIYIIVSNGPERKRLEKMVKNLNLGGKVIFTGYISDDQLATFYQLADVFIMVSRETLDKDIEGFGMVYLEANIFLKPVIAGRSGGVGDAVVDGKNGLLVNPTSINEITEAIIKLMKNRELRHRLGSYGRQRVERDFKWTIQTQKIERILK